MLRSLGIVSPNRIRVNYYHYRSIPQLQCRLEVRAEARRYGHPNWQMAPWHLCWVKRLVFELGILP